MTEQIVQTPAEDTLTADQIERRIRALAPGQSFTYYVGHLIFDRDHDEDIDAIGRRAFALYGQNVCTLTQKKLAEMRQGINPPIYQYFAVRRETNS